MLGFEADPDVLFVLLRCCSGVGVEVPLKAARGGGEMTLPLAGVEEAAAEDDEGGEFDFRGTREGERLSAMEGPRRLSGVFMILRRM